MKVNEIFMYSLLYKQFLDVVETTNKPLMADHLLEIIIDRFGLSLDLTQKADLDYATFVMKHKAAVYNAGVELMQKEKFPKQLKDTFTYNLLIHDLSKFGAKESSGYMGYNFKDKTLNTAEVTAAFEQAWHHHYSVNEHHPEYWMHLSKGAIVTLVDMPAVFVLEMIADWIGAGRTYGNELETWLPANLPNFVFSVNTAIILQDYLQDLLGIYTVRACNESSTPTDSYSLKVTTP